MGDEVKGTKDGDDTMTRDCSAGAESQQGRRG
jgi:hypothetical protein